MIGPAIRHDALGGWAKAVAVSYPLVDLLLLGGLVCILVQRRARSAAEWSLVGWLTAQLSGDLLYTHTWLNGTFTYGH